MKKALKIALNVIIAILFIAAAAAVGSVLIELISGRAPAVFGYRLYIVQTDSMTPELEPQDLILSKIFKDADDVKTKVKQGDIVTFVVEYGDLKGLTITHKVVEEPHFDEEKNRYVILTQGTKAGATVDPPVPIENVRAIFVKNMPAMGKFFGFFRNSAVIWLVLISVFALIVFLVTGLVRGIIANKKKEEEEKAAAGKTEEEIVREKLRKEVINEYLQEKDSEKNEENRE